MYKMGILTIINYATKIFITKLLNLILEFISLTNSLFNVQGTIEATTCKLWRWISILPSLKTKWKLGVEQGESWRCIGE
jgi:hypothetical protein